MEAHGDHVRSHEITGDSYEISSDHGRSQEKIAGCPVGALSETMSSGWDVGDNQAGAGDMHHQMCLGDSCTPTWYILRALPPPLQRSASQRESAHFEAQKEQMGIEGLGKGGAWSQETHAA